MSKPTYNPTRRRLIAGAAASLLLTACRIGLAKDKSVDKLIIAIRIWPALAYTRLSIESTQALHFKYMYLHNPERLVIDIPDIQVNHLLRNLHKQVINSDPYIKAIRVGQFNTHTTRLVLELKHPVKAQLFSLNPVAEFNHRLVADLYPKKEKQTYLSDDSSDLDTEPLKQFVEPQIKSIKKTKPIIIMLDPGHGGEDPGATGAAGTHEKNVVLKIAKQLKKMIEQEKNMQVYLTREDDVFIPLGVRVSKARKARADLLISIHADAFITSSARGSSVFALTEKGATSVEAKFLAKTQNESDRIGGVKISGKDSYLAHTLFDLTQTATINDSLSLGKLVLDKIGHVNTLHKDYVEQAGFAVLKAPDVPSILVETAFISNHEEERKLNNSNFQKEIASAILSGIKSYFMTRI